VRERVAVIVEGDVELDQVDAFGLTENWSRLPALSQGGVKEIVPDH
jgi:hypothetical protein